MAYTVPRDVVDAFYRAYQTRDPDHIGAMLDDNVEWVVVGPVEVMQMCGSWRGKAGVMERFATLVPSIVKFTKLHIDTMLVDGDCSAMFGSISCIHRASGRKISHRLAHLVRYRDGKVVNMRVMNDSLDAAEQYVGHPIALTDDAPAMVDNEIIAI